MTATPVAQHRPDVSTVTVLRRAAAAEWARMWTLRSTWWALLVAAGMMLFIGVVAASGHDGSGPAPIWQPAQIAIVPGQFAFLLVVLVAVTGEYSTGSIRSSLQWVPRRGVLLAARTVVPVAFATGCAVLVAAGTDLVVWSLLDQTAEVDPGDIAASLGRVAVVVAFGGLLTVGLSLLVRSTAGTLTAIFLLVLVLPISLGNTGVPALVAISDAMPGRAIVSMVVLDEVELAVSTVITVMIAWTAAATVAGGWSLLRRDTI